MPLHQLINNCLIFYYTFIAQKEANCSLYQAILHLYYCCSQVNSFLQCFLLSLAKLVSQKFCCCTRQLFGNLRLIGFFIVSTQYNGSRTITIMHYYCNCCASQSALSSFTTGIRVSSFLLYNALFLLSIIFSSSFDKALPI